MDPRLNAPFRLSALLVALMAAQALLGLLFQGAYRDVAWIRASWYGNDGVTLLVAVPLLIAALALTRQGSTRGLLVWLGLLGYSVYNYAFYLFGVALNAFFPLYVTALLVAVVVLILLLPCIDVAELADAFAPRTPVRLIGGYLAVIAVMFFVLWFGLWAAYVFADRPTPTPEPEAFKLVAALDLTLMMPALATGGVLLWRRHPWGYLLAAVAAIQGTLYLVVLAVNAVVAIGRGLAAAPGQLPIWGTLGICTAVAAVLLLSQVRPGRDRPLGRRASPRERPTLGA